MKKHCLLCGKLIKVHQNLCYAVCDDCKAAFEQRRKEKPKQVCYLCGKEFPKGKHVRHYCCDEHARISKTLQMRPYYSKYNKVEKPVIAERKPYRGQKFIDEVAARARANGISYGMQKMVDNGLLRLG